MSSKANKLVEQASDALAEFSDGTFGKFLSQSEETKGVTEVHFESTAKGYKGWHWVVTLTQPDKRKAATVAEINMLAGPDAQLAPEWVPWSERLKEFRRQLREEGRAKTDAEADALIGEMGSVVSDHDEGDSSKQDANDGGVEPPKKTRVRKRLVKREQNSENDNPDESADKDD
jgi:hypothetical protein